MFCLLGKTAFSTLSVTCTETADTMVNMKPQFWYISIAMFITASLLIIFKVF